MKLRFLSDSEMIHYALDKSEGSIEFYIDLILRKVRIN